MKSNFTLMMTASVLLFASCSKNEFNERDAVEAQKELLNLKYQHELDLETLKQKGANALQELINTAALQQLKLNDSLAAKSAVAAKKQDYTVTVVDAFTNSPIEGADVTVSSEGKLYSVKTTAEGSATFSSLYLFPTSSFLISKTGYAATQITQQYIYSGAAKLWNTADLSNEITGTLYIETDLTNSVPEKVGENVLVTATSTIQSSGSGSYSIYFPAYTDAAGNYAIKLPAVTNGYTLAFQQVAADQKLFVNATEDDVVTTFPSSLPRVTTIKTYFNVNSFNTAVPAVYNYYYFKVAPDKNGKVLYIPGYSSYNGYNQVYLSAVGDKYQVERLNVNAYYYNSNGAYSDYSAFTYEANSKVDVEMIDAAGNIIQTGPQLSGATNASGKLTYSYSPEGGSGIVHLKRDAAGALVANAKGVLLKANAYDSYNNLYNLSFSASLNTATSKYVNNSYLLPNKGDKKVANFYYGAGDSRVKQVY